jgi:hypothetical protein
MWLSDDRIRSEVQDRQHRMHAAAIQQRLVRQARQPRPVLLPAPVAPRPIPWAGRLLPTRLWRALAG